MRVPGKHLTDEQRQLLVDLLESNAPYREIRSHGFSSSTVAIMRRRLEAGSTSVNKVAPDYSASLAKIVERVNAAHVHEPTIKEGAYFAGTSGRLDVRYANRGPGAWHHAHIITYPSGKRTIVTMNQGRWRA